MFKVILLSLLFLRLDASSPSDEEYYKEMEKCFTENGLYIRGCDVDSIYHAMVALNRTGKSDENSIRCTMYDMVSRCYVNRIEEKCGEENAKLARRRLEKRPSIIAKACLASVGATDVDADENKPVA